MNEEIKCKTHPDAPHGFVRNASHTQDRYVCECEYWEEPKVNERIKLLAERAGLKSEIMVDESNLDVECFLTQYDASVPSIHYWENFAQLIVQECARIARATPCPYEEDEVRHRLGHTWDMASLEAGREIGKHFGVEE